MLKGNNMKKSYTGMRKGLSLMEMLIAIVLFGLITSIGYIYYKNYYDTSYAAKQARVYVVVDQATQLANAYDLYSIKYGIDANTTQLLLDDKLITAIPLTQTALNDDGGVWELNTTVNLNNVGGANDVAFTFDINSTSASDDLDYCNILNRLAYRDWNTTAGADQNTSVQLWTDGNASTVSTYNQQEYFHCSVLTAGTTDKSYRFVFVKKLND